MFFSLQLGAEAVAPQVGSVVLLTVFYLTDFQLVSIIPKAAFASLLVLAFIDMVSLFADVLYFVDSCELTPLSVVLSL